jgi:hypothetical protein
MLGLCIARTFWGNGFPTQHQKFFKWSISRSNYSTAVEYRPIRSVLVANRGESLTFTETVLAEIMRIFHVVIFHTTLILNSLFCVLTEDQGYGWHEEYLKNSV